MEEGAVSATARVVWVVEEVVTCQLAGEAAVRALRMIGDGYAMEEYKPQVT